MMKPSHGVGSTWGSDQSRPDALAISVSRGYVAAHGFEQTDRKTSGYAALAYTLYRILPELLTLWYNSNKKILPDPMRGEMP